MRIATWNLERPRNAHSQRSQLITEKIREIDADIWILTETHDEVTPGDGYQGISTDPVPEPPIIHKDGEHRTTIWTRWSIIKTIPTSSPDRTVCADIETPFGPLLVYGTIIPYHRHGCPPHGTAKQWESHYISIATQGAEWQRLKRQFPSSGFCVAGDYNQNRDGGRWYGTKRGRSLLTQALSESNLHCVTEEDFIASGKLPKDGLQGKDGKLWSRRCIDHISLNNEWADLLVEVTPWPGEMETGYHLSDHGGVLIDLIPK